MAATSEQTVRVTYVKSAIGYAHDQKATIRSLGLRRLNQTVTLPDNPSVRGMCFKVRHLVRVEDGAEQAGE
jgi:large subunit ribosomal protein L30